MSAPIRALALVATITVFASIYGCSAQFPLLAACKADAFGETKLRARLFACTAAIRQGAKGGDLEKVLAYRGESYRQLSDDDHAKADFDAALRIDPKDTMALNDRGLVYISQDQFALALADFDAAISTSPNDVFPYSNRGIADRFNRDFDQAIHDENRAIELNPNWAEPWANRGYAYNGKRQWEMALADFDNSLRLAPGNAWALQGRAGAERGKGRPDLALKDLNQVLAKWPRNEGALLGRAGVYADKGDFDDALRDVNQAIALHPRQPGPYASRSEVYLRQGAHAGALADAQTAVALRPDDAATLTVRCSARAVIGADLAAALADCQQALALRPNWVPALDSLAFIRFRQGHFDQAISGYDAVLAREPQSPAARFMRGVARLRAGDKAGAADITAATAADPRIPGLYAAFGVKP